MAGDGQRIEAIIFLSAHQYAGQRRFDAGAQPFPIAENMCIAGFEQEIMNPAEPTAGQIEGEFLDHRQPEIFEHRHRLGQRDDLAKPVDLQAQLLRRIAGLADQPDAAVSFVVQRAQRHQIGGRLASAVLGPIAGRQRPAMAEYQSRCPRRRGAGDQRGFQILVPTAHQLAQPAIELGFGRRVEAQCRALGHADDIMDTRQPFGAQFNLEPAERAAGRVDQHASHILTHAAGVAVTWHIDEHRQEAAKGVGPGKQLGPRPVEQR